MTIIETKKDNPKGIVVAVAPKMEAPERIDEFLTELEFLAGTLEIEIINRFAQKLEHPESKTFVGKGKLKEIDDYVKMMKVNVVVFDDDLTPSQLRNLEKQLKVKIYDRSLLILDIFLKRAKTAQAKTQVELARYQYLLPRLTRMWTHLERQRGGTGTRGGAGEKEIETDRRNIRNQISVLRKKLDKMEKQAQTRRKSRDGVVRVALVGYTNAGKSTIMRLLSKEKVYTKDELFATVDSTVRKVVLNNIPFLLSDTVGFIRKLPHDLIESFKSTLSEVNEADILLHVVDVSNPAIHDHLQVVSETLDEIGASSIETITVFNKTDQVEDLDELKLDLRLVNGQSVFMSAKTKNQLDQLREVITKKVSKFHFKIYPNYTQDQVY
ncbi:MAG: GTPase HflX [Cytophagales bacterium]|nr:GTPase HflX [Cytophagales bacterium]